MAPEDSVHDLPGVELRPGQSVTIAKTHWGSPEPDWTYDGVIVAHELLGDWVAAECAWGRDDADVDGLKFIRGGKILEFFSPTRRFNIFRVFAPNGDFTGIYANITAPTTIHLDETGQPIITWEDHWLDVVKLPDGTTNVLDEDEYAESGVAESEPQLDRDIRQAVADLLDELDSGIWDV